jgi:putative transposase
MKQLEFSKVNGWGGSRRGSGRKNLTGKVSHMPREEVNLRIPLLCHTKIKPGIITLRREDLHEHFQKAIQRIQKFDVFVIGYALLDNHIHIIVEAKNNSALNKGMKSLFGSIAKQIKKLQNVEGPVFHGPYHLRTINNPTQMRNAYRYVLLNAAKHAEQPAHIDEFSSGKFFPHWRKLTKLNGLLECQLCIGHATSPETVGLAQPKSWIAQRGWLRAA